MFFKVFGAEVWLQMLPRGQTPLYPHPEGRRFGVVREEDGEVLVYAGRVHVILTPRGWVAG
jgi:hypothetical protein